jgi:hypothetical protein
MVAPRKCRGCPALIYDLTNERTGKTAPIDVEPVAGGNILVDLQAGTYRLVGWSIGDPPKHKNHFATCPNAGAFR